MMGCSLCEDDFFIQKFGNFGREDGALFSKRCSKAMIKEADGNPRKLEALLGLDEGSLGDSPKMVLPQEVHNTEFLMEMREDHVPIHSGDQEGKHILEEFLKQ